MKDYRVWGAIIAVIAIAYIVMKKLSAPAEVTNSTPVSVSIDGPQQAVDDIRGETLSAKTQSFQYLSSVLAGQSSSRDARTVELNKTAAELASTRYVADTNYALADLTAKTRLAEMDRQFNYINQLSGDDNKSRLAIKLNTAGTIWGSQNASNYDFKQDKGFLEKLGNFITSVTKPITDGLKTVGI